MPNSEGTGISAGQRPELPTGGAAVPAFKTKSEVTYEVLREWIVSGELEPGQRLDQEWLAGTLKVSRMPLRQALQRLESEGLIQNRPYRGAVVSPLSPREMEDIYAARAALEGTLAEVGARRCSAEQLVIMEDLLNQQAGALADRDMRRFATLDRAFHFTLYEASTYPQCLSIVERLWHLSERYRRFYATTKSGAENSLREHWQILETARAHEGEGARKATAAHVERGFQVLSRLITGQGSQG